MYIFFFSYVNTCKFVRVHFCLCKYKLYIYIYIYIYIYKKDGLKKVQNRKSAKHIICTRNVLGSVFFPHCLIFQKSQQIISFCLFQCIFNY